MGAGFVVGVRDVGVEREDEWMFKCRPGGVLRFG